MLHDETKLKEYSRCEWIKFRNMKTESRVFRNHHFFYIHHSKEFWEMIFHSRNITIAICTYSEGTDQQHLHVQFKANLSQVQFKFWGDKKWPVEGFILSWISIFVSSLSFELSKLFNIFHYVPLYLVVHIHMYQCHCVASINIFLVI